MYNGSIKAIIVRENTQKHQYSWHVTTESYAIYLVKHVDVSIAPLLC